MTNKKHNIWIEINEEALSHNVKQFKKRLGRDVSLFAVVKSNAYGHGLTLCGPIVLKAGADGLAVNSIDEALILRESNIKSPVMILSYVPLARLPEAVNQDLDMVVYNLESLRALNKIGSKLNKKAKIHLKIETGTNRQGLMPEQIDRNVDLLKKSEFLKLAGFSTHYANIEDTTVHTYAGNQLEEFAGITEKFEQKGIKAHYKHTACTAAAILFDETFFNLARVGIGLYGLWPSKETYLSSLMTQDSNMELIPVMTWKTRIAQIKTVSRGAFVGYGCTYRTTRKTKLAVLPVGYYDGYDRLLSNRAHVLIKGQRAPVRGRVCMNHIMADVTDIPGVRLEDEAVLLGKNGNEVITAENLAQLCGTINYEIVSRINPIHPRILV